MKIIRASDYRRSRWKNGGGETAEIAVFPPGASLDGFGWRVSMARVETDGAFSVFPGVDRTLSILSGNGMILDVDGQNVTRLDTTSPPYSFPADIPTFARLVQGPVDDLNVMTRRGQFAHRVTRHVIASRLELPANTPVTLLVCQSGSAEIAAARARGQLGAGDSLLLENKNGGPLSASIAGQAQILAGPPPE